MSELDILARKALARRALKEAETPLAYGEVPEGMVFNPYTNQYTNREMLKANAPDGAANAMQHGFVQGGTFGASDEILGTMARLRGPGTADERANFVREKARANLEAARENNPVAAYGSEVVGAIGMPGASLKGAASLPLAARSLAHGAAAAGGGAAYGFNTGEGGFEDRAKEAWKTALMAGAIGAAAPAGGALTKAIVEKIMKGRATRNMVKAAPSTDQLRAVSKRAFKKADKATGLDRSKLTNATSGIVDGAVRQGMDDVLTPQSSRAVERIADAATSPKPTIGLRELDVLRRQAQVPAGNMANKTESAIGKQLVEKIDDVIDAADPSLGKEISKAREMWGRMRRTEMLEEGIDRAEDAASGYENGLRIRMRAILNSKKDRAKFSEDEIAAMKRVVHGTRTGNALKKLGKFGLGVDQQSNFLGASVGVAGGAAIGNATGLGPIGAVIPLALGTAAQKASLKNTRKQMEIAKALVASGGKAPAPKLTEAQRAVIEEMLRRGSRTAPVLD